MGLFVIVFIWFFFLGWRYFVFVLILGMWFCFLVSMFLCWLCFGVKVEVKIVFLFLSLDEEWFVFYGVGELMCVLLGVRMFFNVWDMCLKLSWNVGEILDFFWLMLLFWFGVVFVLVVVFFWFLVLFYRILLVIFVVCWVVCVLL